VPHAASACQLLGLCRLLQSAGVEFVVTALPLASSLRVRRAELSFLQYQNRRAAFELQQRERSSSSSQQPPSSWLSSPLSATVLPCAFLLLSSSAFCLRYRDVSELWRCTQPLCQQAVHVFVYWPACAPSSSSLASPASQRLATTDAWLQSKGRLQLHAEHACLQSSLSSLQSALRQLAMAERKQEQEAALFRFGSRRVRKGRTAAMKGSNPRAGISSRPQQGIQSDSEEEEEAAGEEGEDEQEEEEDRDAAAAGASSASALLSCVESWIHVLCIIRGVSEEKAAVISRRFPSARALTEAYSRQPDSEQAALLLADLQSGNRRIGEQVSRRVHAALYQR
jgi:hypothetical protein